VFTDNPRSYPAYNMNREDIQWSSTCGKDGEYREFPLMPSRRLFEKSVAASKDRVVSCKAALAFDSITDTLDQMYRITKKVNGKATQTRYCGTLTHRRAGNGGKDFVLCFPKDA
jgi:hypothetical protein